MVIEQKVRAFLFYLSLVIFLTGLPFILSFALGYEFNTRAFKFTKTGLLVIKTQPQGAGIHLDGKELDGKTPYAISELMPSEYNLRLELKDYYPWKGKVWAIIIIVIAPLPLLFGGSFFNQMAIGYNLPKITGLLLNFTFGTSLAWIILSRTILPRRPKNVSWSKNLVMVAEWLIVPLVILILGSTPALDAQTRLILGKYMEFNPTEKIN